MHYGDDSYLQSDLGLVSGLDRRYGVDLNWTVNEKIAAYATLGREKIDSRTRGSSTFTAADWNGNVQDDFETYGAGVNAQFTDKISVNIDYTYGDGNSRTSIVGTGDGNFPAVSSELSSFKAGVTYGFNERTDLMLSWWYETLKTSDWSFVVAAGGAADRAGPGSRSLQLRRELRDAVDALPVRRVAGGGSGRGVRLSAPRVAGSRA